MIPVISGRSILGGGLAFAGATAGQPRSASSQAVPRSSGPPNGSLIIIGGGTGGGVGGLEIIKAAISLSSAEGGSRGRWVVIPTAGARRNRWDTLPSFLSGTTFAVLDARDRRQADSEAFVAPLLTATGVYFCGGWPGHLVDIYAGTRTEREIRAVLERGGVIAGNSAGAIIQGSYLVRGDPANTDILMSPGHEKGFGYLTNVAIDPHVVVRGVERDLAKVVAAHPGLLGIGINEQTAVVVRYNTMTVLGNSVVLITDGASHDGKPYYTLTSGAQFDLATWTVLPA